MRWWFAVVAVALLALTVARAQRAAAPEHQEYIAFRVDDQRLIATFLVRAPTPPQIREGLSPRPAARYGYAHFAVPAGWRERSFNVPPLGRWAVHLSPGAVIEATAEEVVGGYAGCEEAVGVLLRPAPGSANRLAVSPARYFVASTSDAVPRVAAESSAVGASQITSSAGLRASIDTILDDLLARELPGVRLEAAASLSRMAASTVGYHRSWARERQRVEAAMARNEGRLRYDVQAFQLGPGAPVYFVRAEWLVDDRQGFAASLWLRTEPAIDVIEVNAQPASWLRMFEFQGRVTRDHLGLVLNVLDRDRDGWGEVLFLQAGYEGFRISSREYSAAGFVPDGLEYGGGC